jgi:DNA modification methylase
LSVEILHGDCRSVLASLPAESVQCVVTSPPYYGLRDYGVDGQIGLEQSPQEYVAQLVAVFAEIRRVLRKDGTAWLNLGDSYAGNTTGGAGSNTRGGLAAAATKIDGVQRKQANRKDNNLFAGMKKRVPDGLKAKDLLLIPARVAIALQDDGWWVRSEIIWSKAAPMPESVRDRPTCAHEKVWLLTKAASYFYDADAVKEPVSGNAHARRKDMATTPKQQANSDRNDGQSPSLSIQYTDRNLRNVWHLNPEPFRGAHFATMPRTIAERCIKAGSRPGDTVLDPFAGAGTTLLMADRLGRHGIGIELNAEYIAIARRRLGADAPLLAEVAA